MKIEKQIAQIIEAIADGMYHPSMKEKMTGLESRKAELTERLSTPPAICPTFSRRLRRSTPGKSQR